MQLDALLRAHQAAKLLGSTSHVLLMWRNRGWLGADGVRHHLAIADRDPAGNPLYRWGDVLAAERATRQTRTHGRRGGTRRQLAA